MSNVGYATLTIIPSARGFAQALTGETNPAMGRAGTEGGEEINKGLMGSVKKLAGLAAGAFAAARIGAFVKDAVAGASDLEQSVGAIETVFKDSSGQMLDWSKNAATAVGLTQNDYNQLGTLIGTQLKNGGTAMDQIAGKTNDLIGVGADLSSMFGGSTQEAVEALSSALKGERDPIERYGVSLTQASIDAKAAELGFQKVGGSLSGPANQAATLALIMDQTKDAAGNFGREADTLAHKQQVLGAMWENGKTQIGQAFLPAVSALTGVLISALGPALDVTVKGLSFVTDAVKLVAGSFTGAGADVDLGPMQGPLIDFGTWLIGFVGTLKDTFGQIGSAFAPFIPQILGALSSLLPAFASVLPSLSPFQIILQGLLPILPQIASFLGAFASDLASILGPALTQIAPLLSVLASTLAGALSAALPQVLPLVSALEGVLFDLIPVVAQVIGAVLPLATVLIAQLMPIFMQLVSQVLPPAIAIISALAKVIAPVVNILLAFLIPAVQALMPVIVTVFGVVVDVISAAMKIVQGIIEIVTGIISGNWDQVWDGIKTVFSGIWDAIKAIVVGAFTILNSLFVAGLGILKSAISTGLSALVQVFGGLKDKVLGALGDVGNWFVSVGRNLIDGLLGGVKDVAGKIKDAVLGPIKDSVDAVKKFLGIHSPSRLFREIGGYTGEGMALGLEDSAPLIAEASRALIPEAPSVASPDFASGAYGSGLTGSRTGGAAVFNITESTSAVATAQEVARRQKGQGV